MYVLQSKIPASRILQCPLSSPPPKKKNNTNNTEENREKCKVLAKKIDFPA